MFNLVFVIFHFHKPASAGKISIGNKLSTARGAAENLTGELNPLGQQQVGPEVIPTYTLDGPAAIALAIANLGIDIVKTLGTGVIDILDSLFGKDIKHQFTQVELDHFLGGPQAFDITSGGLSKIAGSFAMGGIIPGAEGQSQLVVGHGGEEVLTRDDSRHSMNRGGGISVTITGNNINSELDIRRLGEAAGEAILNQLKLQTKFVR